MKSTRVLKSILTVSACAIALVIAVGCSSGSGSAASSGSSSSTASSASASSAATASTSSAASSASTSASASSASASSASGLTAESAKAQGYQVFEGTIHVCTAEELVKLQAIDIDPAVASGGGTYAVLVFDKDTDVVGESADGSGQRTESCNMLGIAEHTEYSSFVIEYGNLDYCKTLDGQKAMVAAKAENIMFPTDVSLPIGQPKAQENVILS